MHRQSGFSVSSITAFGHRLGKVLLTNICHHRLLVHEILGIRASLCKLWPAADSQDRMDQIITMAEAG